MLEEAKKGAKAAGKEILTKSSIMLGVGEMEEEIHETLRRQSPPLRRLSFVVFKPQLTVRNILGLRESDVDVVTFGQYMRPTKRHMKVDRYVEPEEFAKWKNVAEGMGFLYVASGPLVRSSYKVSCLFFFFKQERLVSDVVLVLGR